MRNGSATGRTLVGKIDGQGSILLGGGAEINGWLRMDILADQRTRPAAFCTISLTVYWPGLK